MLKLKELPGRFQIGRLPADAVIPEAVAVGTDFSVVSRTDEELSVFCREGLCGPFDRLEGGWKVLQVVGPFAFDQVGLLVGIAGPLAEAGVAILAMGTFDTDYVAVKGERWEAAVEALRGAGHTVVLAREA